MAVNVAGFMTDTPLHAKKWLAPKCAQVYEAIL